MAGKLRNVQIRLRQSFFADAPKDRGFGETRTFKNGQKLYRSIQQLYKNIQKQYRNGQKFWEIFDTWLVKREAYLDGGIFG
jgi:hypothetical protein